MGVNRIRNERRITVKQDLPKIGDVIEERCGGSQEFWQPSTVLVVMMACDGYCIGHGTSQGDIQRFVRLCDVGVTWRWPLEPTKPCPTCGHLPKGER